MGQNSDFTRLRHAAEPDRGRVGRLSGRVAVALNTACQSLNYGCFRVLALRPGLPGPAAAPPIR